LYFDRPSGNAVFTRVLNPPARSVTLRWAVRTLGGPPPGSSLSVYEYDSPLPSSAQDRGPVGAAVVDRAHISHVGQHGYNIVEGINLNAVDFGNAYLPQFRIRRRPRRPRGRPRSPPIRCAHSAAGAITQNVSRGWVTHHSLRCR
jgi:hypothetical protein